MLILLFSGLLQGCLTLQNTQPDDFEEQYEAARQTLESGDARAAAEQYKSLISVAESRHQAALNLEYAYALLASRALPEAHDAAMEAQSRAKDNEIETRAILIAAIAQQEMASAQIEVGTPYEAAADAARQAYLALENASVRAARFDPDGVAQTRLVHLRDQMAGLEFRQAKQEAATGQTSIAIQRARYIQTEFNGTEAATMAAAWLKKQRPAG